MKIFGNRISQMKEQAVTIRPGELAERNSLVVGMAAKHVRYPLAAITATLVISYLAKGRLDTASKAYETFHASFTLVMTGLIGFGVVYALFEAAKWAEAQAVRLDTRQSIGDPEDPPLPAVRRFMQRAIFMIQLGYRLVSFAGVCLAIGVIFAIKGFFEI